MLTERVHVARLAMFSSAEATHFSLKRGKMGCLRCCCVVCHLYCLITFLLSTSVHYYIRLQMLLQCLYIQYSQAAEVYDKLGDHKSLVLLYVNSFQWDNVRYNSTASTMYGVYIHVSV